MANLLVGVSGMLLASTEAEPGLADPDLALWTLVVFCLLMVLLYTFAWGPVCEALDKREESIRNDLEAARKSAEQAREAQIAYESKLALAADEANKLVSDARVEAERARARIVNEAEAEADRVKTSGMAEVEMAKRAAVNELAQSSVDNAVGLAGRMIGKTLDKDSHAELIRESLEKFKTPKAN